MVVRQKSEGIQDYLVDESNQFHADEDQIDAVFYPISESEVIELIQSANEENKKVTISGAGTGITGGRVPVHGGIVISMENNLLSGGNQAQFDEANRKAIVSPGLPLLELGRHMPAHLFYPPDPTETSAMLGSTLATNASGARSYHYGPTRDWISGFRAVLANGDLLNLKRGQVIADSEGFFDFQAENGNAYRFTRPKYQMPDLKNAAGLYTKPDMDLVDLLIGSEGIFCIFTEIEIKLAETFGEIISDIAFFATDEEAIGFVNDLKKQDTGILSIEYFNETSLDFIREGIPSVAEEMKAAVFTEISDEDDYTMESLAHLLEKHCSREDWCASGPDTKDLKEFRHALPDRVNTYLKDHDSYKLGTDFVVPQAQFPEMMDIYNHTGQAFKQQYPRPGVHYVIFGHIGDCHVHFNFITQTEEELNAAKQHYAKMAEKAISFGGTISGEHGVGKKTIQLNGQTIPYLELMYGRPALDEIARIKKVFDPNLILNIGNMVPKEYL